MFGRKDPMKEFEQMRQALKPAERFAARPESESSGNAPTTEEKGMAVKNEIAHETPMLGADLGEGSSVVSFGSSWEGTLKIEGSVRIDGQVTGEIDARETVYVAESAKVDAKVRAKKVVIAGDIEGEVFCSERLEIMPTGRVRAELTTKSLTVFEGAFIEGQIHMARIEAAVATPPVSVKSDGGLKLVAEKSAKVTLAGTAEHN
jgi:cytoskeletal protein CcmA (bactofilin family)